MTSTAQDTQERSFSRNPKRGTPIAFLQRSILQGSSRCTMTSLMRRERDPAQLDRQPGRRRRPSPHPSHGRVLHLVAPSSIPRSTLVGLNPKHFFLGLMKFPLLRREAFSSLSSHSLRDTMPPSSIPITATSRLFFSAPASISDLSTGNHTHASVPSSSSAALGFPSLDASACRRFTDIHAFPALAVVVLVDDASEAFLLPSPSPVTATSRRFFAALASLSDLSTGNHTHASYFVPSSTALGFPSLDALSVPNGARLTSLGGLAVAGSPVEFCREVILRYLSLPHAPPYSFLLIYGDLSADPTPRCNPKDVPVIDYFRRFTVEGMGTAECVLKPVVVANDSETVLKEGRRRQMIYMRYLDLKNPLVLCLLVLNMATRSEAIRPLIDGANRGSMGNSIGESAAVGKTWEYLAATVVAIILTLTFICSFFSASPENLDPSLRSLAYFAIPCCMVRFVRVMLKDDRPETAPMDTLDFLCLCYGLITYYICALQIRSPNLKRCLLYLGVVLLYARIVTWYLGMNQF